MGNEFQKGKIFKNERKAASYFQKVPRIWFKMTILKHSKSRWNCIDKTMTLRQDRDQIQNNNKDFTCFLLSWEIYNDKWSYSTCKNLWWN